MDQEVFFDVQPFDRRKVDLSKPATTVEEYMKQVIVSREQCPQIVVANTVKIPSSQAPLKNLIPKDKSIDCVCPLAPGNLWNVDRSTYFGEQRNALEKYRHIADKKMGGIKLPSVAEKDKWLKLCFEERIESFPISSQNNFTHHFGTPPTLNFVMHLTDNQVNHLLPYQIEYCMAHGYSRPVLQWIFALLLVVKKPLLQDVCSSIRELARECRIWRSQFTGAEVSKIYECSAIIAIVSIYFGQRDLSD